MKLLSWNLNSIRKRMERLLAVLKRHQPDVVCLQETKTPVQSFPFGMLQDAGYHAVAHGEPRYNGVAILARTPLTDVQYHMQDGAIDSQARLIAATVMGVRMVCVYVPNGQTVGSDAYAYKLAWMERLRAYLDRCCAADQPLLVAGDFNVAPYPTDVARPDQWEHTVLFHPEVRKALAHVTAWGLVDVLHVQHPGGGVYSWWDYRRLGFAKNDGLRIDLVYASKPLANSLIEAQVDRNERKGRKGSMPSDHAPVWASFEYNACKAS